ncbi:MAG: hypothetical protein QXT53_01505 [Ignisphaera sp.]
MGVGKMICSIASENIPEKELEKLLDFTALETRRSRGKFFTLIFIASSTKNAFRYRDIFTKYLDLGIRIYIENNIVQSSELLNMCKKILYSKNDLSIQSLINNIKNANASAI